MPKNIVFCADGTWNHPDEMDDGLPADTNVYKFYKALTQSATQAPHYDDGVGSDGTPIDKLLGGAIGDGLFQKIKDGYTVIARSYQTGDGIYLFGFSRGAYTARSLAGMIAVCGIPSAGKFTDQATEDAFDAYRDKANRAAKVAAFFAKYSAQDANIVMVGVWDTVGSLGIPVGVFAGLDEQVYGFLDTNLHPDVQTAIHALSIDERRSEFVPTLWTTASSSGQTVEQVWYAGVHSDVGGGYAQTGLSDVALGWMIARAAGRGLIFESGVFQTYTQLDPKHSLDAVHESWNVAWGFPKRRAVPPGSLIANSVAIRISNEPNYRPPNVPPAFPNSLGTLQIVRVVEDPPTS